MAVVAGVISAALILSGCRSAVSLFWSQPRKATSALDGTYVADHKFAKETLTLNPDGTYVQQAISRATGGSVSLAGNGVMIPERPTSRSIIT